MNDVQVIKRVNLEPRLKQAVGYARVSTADEHQDSSYKLQIEELERSIRANPNYHFIGVFKDRKSGRDTKHRQEFNAMIELALMGEIDIIITKSITRFARNILDTITIIRKLKINNVEVIFQKENISSLDPSIEMILTILASHAEEESNNISENIKWSIRKKVRKGGNFTTYLYGYTIDGEKWKINPKEANVIRLIFDMYIQNKTYKSMVERLYELGVKSPTGMEKWSKGSIESMVQNEKYAGHMSLGKTFIYKDTRIRSSRLDKQDNMIMNHHVPIVDPSVFDTAMAIRLKRTKNTIDGYVPWEKRVSAFYQFVYSKENGKYLRYVLEKPKGKYNIPTLYCYNNDAKNRVMITVNNLYKILNASLDKLSKSINDLGSSFSEIINNSLYKCDLSLKSNPDNKIELLSNKVVLLDAKKKLPSFIKSIKRFSDLDDINEFKKLISGVEIIDNDTIKVKLSLVSDAILNYPIFESTISLKIGNSNKDITYYLFI